MNCLIVLIPGIILKGNLIHDCPIVVIALEVKLNNNELTLNDFVKMILTKNDFKMIL